MIWKQWKRGNSFGTRSYVKLGVDKDLAAQNGRAVPHGPVASGEQSGTVLRASHRLLRFRLVYLACSLTMRNPLETAGCGPRTSWWCGKGLEQATAPPYADWYAAHVRQLGGASSSSQT